MKASWKDLKGFEEFAYSISLINSVINNTAPPLPPENINWPRLEKLCTVNATGNIVFEAISKLKDSGEAPQEIFEKLKRHTQREIALETRQMYYLGKLVEEYEKNELDILVIKGAITKKIYPRTYYRHMDDLDIITLGSDFDRYVTVLTDNGFSLIKPGDVHDLYGIKKVNMFVELHRKIVSEAEPLFCYFDRVKIEKKISFNGKRHVFTLSDEDMYLYSVGHMAKHLLSGGISIRMILEVYVYNKYFEGKLDRRYIENELEKLSLLKFEEETRNLSFKWFSPEGADVQKDLISLHVFSSFKSGLEGNHVSSMNLRYDHKETSSQIRSKKVTLKSRLFPSRESMAQLYPILKRYYVLVPFCWLHMWFSRLFIKRDIVLNPVRRKNAKIPDYSRELKQLFEYLDVEYMLKE